MKKSELIKKVADQVPGVSPQQAALLVQLFWERVADALKQGNRVELRGLGTFGTRHRMPGIRRNPCTGTTFQAPARRIPHFRPGRQLRRRLNPPL